MILQVWGALRDAPSGKCLRKNPSGRGRGAWKNSSRGRACFVSWQGPSSTKTSAIVSASTQLPQWSIDKPKTEISAAYKLELIYIMYIYPTPLNYHGNDASTDSFVLGIVYWNEQHKNGWLKMSVTSMDNRTDYVPPTWLASANYPTLPPICTQGWIWNGGIGVGHTHHHTHM